MSLQRSLIDITVPMLAVLEADRVCIAQLQSQIMDLERSLSDLRLEQSIVQQRLDAYEYPVLTLPNEITSEIFLHILPPYPHFPPLAGALSPILLTQICRRWQEIALGIPKLWSAISSPAECTSHGESRMVRLWLERSGSSPLDLTLGRYGQSPHVSVVEALILQRARWKHLKVTHHADTHPTFDGPMPLLRHLQLSSSVGRSMGTVSISQAPLLRTVVLDDVAASHVTLLPWAQLTSLTLSNVYPSECFPILVQTLNLVHCDLGLHPGPDLGHRRDIPLLCLDSLVMSDVGRRPVTNLLPTLIVPALRRLEIPEYFLEPNPIDSLKTFISKSGCKLEELHLTGAVSVPGNSYRRAFPLLWLLSKGDDEGGDSVESD
ncbi:hypothetical protein C8R47DRAFT_1223079 [Mycena vitilis]|nr:hypothetical protein C8R47DRAFT_1223079 [Mycena vitilis]